MTKFKELPIALEQLEVQQELGETDENIDTTDLHTTLTLELGVESGKSSEADWYWLPVKFSYVVWGEHPQTWYAHDVNLDHRDLEEDIFHIRRMMAYLKDKTPRQVVDELVPAGDVRRAWALQLIHQWEDAAHQERFYEELRQAFHKSLAAKVGRAVESFKEE